MTDSVQEQLPDYGLPPVIEVVCGLQFAPLEAFQATAFGLLWERFRARYPICEQWPPLAPIKERFDQLVLEGPSVEFSNTPPLPRVFFVQEDSCWLVQVQTDRLLHNWRKKDDAVVYPHFPEVYKRFWFAWKQFGEFCRDENIGCPVVNQLELTYINHIIEGEGWEGTETIGRVFPDLARRGQRSFLPPPESLTWQCSFSLPSQYGRLHASVRYAIRKEDMKPVLLCELTARGISDDLSDDGIGAWFHLAREWIVRGFADLTHERIQDEFWNRKQ